MATMTITIPDAVLTRVITALCVSHNVPVTAANAKQEVINMIMARVKVYEGNQAAQTAQTSANTDIDTNITLT
jgi:hypothetical protein